MNFAGKRILIAPMSPTSKALADALQAHEPTLEILGYLDNYKTGSDVFSLDQIKTHAFDWVLILSPNHFDSLYRDLKRRVSLSQLVKVQIEAYQYRFYDHTQIRRQRRGEMYQTLKLTCLQWLSRWFDWWGRERQTMALIAKGFVGSNLKAFYLVCLQHRRPVVLLTDNKQAYQRLKAAGLPVVWLGGWCGLWTMAKAYWLIQDQANHTEYFPCFGHQQKTVQIWHGIPLKRLSAQKNICYDLLVSTTEYVTQTSLGGLFEHKNVIHSGYPRNDLLTPGLMDHDALLSEPALMQWVKDKRAQGRTVLVYMPTHREYDVGVDGFGFQEIPLDWVALDRHCAQEGWVMLIKLHPFVEAHYQSILAHHRLKHIRLYPAQADIYSLLAYTDALVTDYSSVYFDYLLLDKPIVFYCYDFETYTENKSGWTYEFEKFTPGPKVYAPDTDQLIRTLDESLSTDAWATDRQTMRKQLFGSASSKTSASERLLQAVDAHS